MISKTKAENLTGKSVEKGRELVKDKKYAICVLAGGQGTRLGINGPKGAYTENVAYDNKSFFEMILVEPLKKGIPVYIMTSNENKEDTENHFRTNKELKKYIKSVTFFTQGERPLKDLEGNPLEIDGQTIYGASGHGSVYRSMRNSGVLEEMIEEGITKVLITNVDNINVSTVDYDFIGESVDTDVTIKSVKKEDPEENVGVFILKDNMLSVIEYTEIDYAMRNRKDSSGLYLQQANIMVQIIDIEFIKKAADIDLKIHVQTKKKWGLEFIKEETFLFDAFYLANSYKIFQVDREFEFAPIKTKEDIKPAILAYIKKKIKIRNLEENIKMLLD